MARGSALGSASTWQNALGCFPLKGRRAAAILGMAAPNRGGWPWALGACLLALRALGHFHEDWENGPGHAWYEQPWVSHVQDFYCDDDCEARLLRATLIDREFKALGRRVQLHDGRAEGGIPRRLRGARRVQGWRRRHHATRGTRPRPRALIPHRLTSPRLPTPTRVLPTGTCDSPSIPHPARAGEQQHVEVHGRMGDHPHSAHVHAHIVHLAQARWVPPPPAISARSRRDIGSTTPAISLSISPAISQQRELRPLLLLRQHQRDGRRASVPQRDLEHLRHNNNRTRRFHVDSIAAASSTMSTT